MQEHPSTRTYLLLLSGILLAFFLAMRVFNDGRPGWKQIVTSDGRGYYAYLPALILDHDPSFAGVTDREARLLGIPHYRPSYLAGDDGQTHNKYFAGEALLLLPFFLAGTLFSWISGSEIDGYSFYFQFFTGLGTLFYLVLGLYFLLKVLERFGIPQAARVIVTTAVLFATNLFYYALWQPTMSHVFSFFAINSFLWASSGLIGKPGVAAGLRAGFFFGVVCLVRPTNAVIMLLFPVMATTRTEMKRFLRELNARKGIVAGIVFVFLAVIAIQPVLWLVQTGHFFLWPYAGEGFRFSHPEIGNVLFSYRKGLFLYTPLAALALAGLIPLWRRDRLHFSFMVLFLAAVTWITASWWNWYYGDSFGLRAFIDFYGPLTLLLGLSAGLLRGKAGSLLLALVLLPFFLFSMIQTWQYTHQVIQPNSMNREKYMYVFLKTDSTVMNCLGGNQEMADFLIDTKGPRLAFFNDFEQPSEGWSEMARTAPANAFSGRHTGYIDSIHPFSAGLMLPAGRLGALPAAFYIEGEVMVFDLVKGVSNRALVVLSMDSVRPGENWWQGFRINDIPRMKSGAWRKCTFSLMTPVIGNHAGTLKIYVWNTGKQPMLLDDFRIRIAGPAAR